MDAANIFTVYALETTTSFMGFEEWLDVDTPWIAGFDFPFSLPQEYVTHLNWPKRWDALMVMLSVHSREQLRTLSKAFCDGREVGNKFAHRLCDIAAGSSSSMKWVNPPVLYMMLEGAPRLAVRNINVPNLRVKANAHGTALEAYPGYLARALIGNVSYKSDDKAKQNAARCAARKLIIERLMHGFALPARHEISAGSAPQLPPLALAQNVAHAALSDASGDSLDAVLCAVQAAMAWQLRQANWGTPKASAATKKRIALEGWVAGA